MDMQKDVLVSDISSVALNDEKKNVAVVVKDIESTQINLENETIIINDGYLDIGLVDTMEDLIVDGVGAFFISVIGYISLKHNKGWIEKLLLKRKKHKLEHHEAKHS